MKREYENVPMPIPDSFPGMPTLHPVDPVALVHEIVNGYTSIKVASRVELTKRRAIREQSRVMIAQIEANTQILEAVMKQRSQERMLLIRMICDLLAEDKLDEVSVNVCKMLLEYLGKNDLTPLLNCKDIVHY